MTITKYGHCCLLIEIAGKRVLTDPGAFSEGFTELTDIDLILITHEHSDHLHTESLRAILEKNPQAKVVANAGVGRILRELNIAYVEAIDQLVTTVANLRLKAYQGQHAEIIGDFGLVQNTGFLLEDGEFFYPGDSYIVPAEKVGVLAAPVAGPWCKVAEAIHYVLEVAPKVVVPVHDAVLSEVGKRGVYEHFTRELKKNDIGFVALIDREKRELA